MNKLWKLELQMPPTARAPYHLCNSRRTYTKCNSWDLTCKCFVVVLLQIINIQDIIRAPTIEEMKHVYPSYSKGDVPLLRLMLPSKK